MLGVLIANECLVMRIRTLPWISMVVCLNTLFQSAKNGIDPRNEVFPNIILAIVPLMEGFVKLPHKCFARTISHYHELRMFS